jgi:hypothetical protein
MSAACGLVLALTVAASIVQAQSPGDAAKPMAVVGVASYDELMQDADYLGGLLGQPGASQMADMMLARFTRGQGLAGLDKSRPMGLLVQASGMAPSFGVCVPVTDLGALLGVAANFGAQATDMGNGITQITVMGQDAYAKDGGAWAFISMAPDALAGLPEDPGAVLVPLTTEYDLALQVNMQNVPEPWRQMATGMMAQAAQAGVKQLPDESAEEFAARQQRMQAALAASQQQITEIDQLTVGLSIASELQRVFLDFVYTAVPGTNLAQQIAANSQATTNFAGFIQPEAAATLSFSAKVDPAAQQQIADAMRQVRDEVNRNVDKETQGATADAIKSAIADFLDAFEGTAQAGAVDGGAVLLAGPERLTLCAGGLVAEPAKIESALKKLADVAASDPSVELPEVQWNAATHGGVAFHVMQAPAPDEKARTVFGDTLEIVVGLGPQSAYFAFGRDAQGALKQVIDASAAEPGKAIPPMELKVSLGQVMSFAQVVADDEAKPTLTAMAGVLTGEAAGRDHVHMIAEGIPNGMRMRFAVEDGVLQAAGSAAQGGMHAAGPPPGAGLQ